MLKLGAQAFEEIRRWVYRNARPLELSLWQHRFEGGDASHVLRALSAYQNADGGFGRALEPDSWNPDSTPYQTLHAIKILKTVGFVGDIHPIARGIREFLGSGAHYAQDLWLFTVPTNDAHPHAPWWTYSPEANEVESIGLTAELSAYAVTHFSRDDETHRRALKSIEKVLGKLKVLDKFGEMGIAGFIVLLDAMRQAGIRPEDELDILSEKVKRLAFDSIERDTLKWAGHSVRPSNYIHSPESPYYAGNEEIVEKELDYLIDTRPQNGVWGIDWSWFENNEIYAAPFAVTENWWKANRAIEKLVFLRNFGRLS